VTDAIGRCHGFLDRHPGCYHPGPGVLPVWASDLLGAVAVLLVIGAFVFAVWVTEREKDKDA